MFKKSLRLCTSAAELQQVAEKLANEAVKPDRQKQVSVKYLF
jgi:hypothetical protein